MSEVRATLDPDTAARLTEFARACKSAARTVSLYPATHPAIASTLRRLAELTSALTSDGPCTLQVLPHNLHIGEAAIAKPDPAVIELADLLRRQLIGSLTLNPGVDVQSWHTLLSLLGRPPEDVRADGGIGRLWAAAGGPSLELREIDYAEVLRERQGEAATIDRIIDAMSGQPLEIDDESVALLRKIAGDREELEAFLKKVVGQAAGDATVTTTTAALLRLLGVMAEVVRRTAPVQLDTLMRQLSAGVLKFTDEVVADFLQARERPEAASGSVNLVNAVTERMEDRDIAGFVADSVIANHGASERLALAFHTLVPDMERQRQLLALAEDRVEASPLGREESFENLWDRVERMLTSYSDAPYVSAEYSRELSSTRTRAVDVEAAGDDPPERIAAWMATVNDSAIRTLDVQLLSDLLTLESDPARWRDVAEIVVQHAEDLVRVGHFDQAWLLVDTVSTEGARAAERAEPARRALDTFGRGAMMKHVPKHLRTADDDVYERFKRVCHAIGPVVIGPLAEVLAAEQDARSRRRLRDILVGFGAAGRESVQSLMTAANWEVRRTAAYLLREFGGSEGLHELRPLLTDAEPLVQREAVQALVLHDPEAAYQTLLEAMGTVSGRPRETLIGEVGALRDDRAAPLFVHIVRTLNRRAFPALYLAAIQGLGGVGGPEAIDALAEALHRGEMFAPVRTRRERSAAAQALRRIGTPEAVDALRHASTRGSWGVRTVAKTELANVRPS
ncbi:MAG TPA: HEAT repeat domain-containing protein [Vicinamibacterales bacterium]|nr:HEAT repeat domain-containing protein [Vicinamibacterales bacterium]